MKRFVSLICVLAIRVMRLVHFWKQNTVNQKTIITLEFSIIENKIISSIDKNKKKLSKPNIYESVRILAHFGGFLGRGVDGDPGITSI